MVRNEPVHTASAWKIGEAVGEVAERGASCYGEHPECGYCNACACIEAVQQEHKPSDRYRRNCE